MVPCPVIRHETLRGKLTHPSQRQELESTGRFADQTKNSTSTKNVKKVLYVTVIYTTHDLPIMPVECTVTYFDHMSKTWLVGKIAQHTHDCAYLTETEAGRLVSCSRHDICRSHLTFVPNLPKCCLKSQSVKAEMPNPRLAPVGGKPSIRQSNASLPTARHHVSGANSQVSSGLVTCSGRVVHKPDRLNL